MSSGEPAAVIKPIVTDLRVATADADNIAPFEAVAELRQQWAARLLDNAAALWDWCLDQKPDTLSSLLAFLVGSSVDAVRYSNHSSGWDRARVANADRLAEAVALDMTSWWHPGQEFFKRVPKAIAMQAVTEAGCDPAVAKGIEMAKKGDAVAAAEQALEGRGWLPAVLRGSPEAAVDEDDEFADDESELIDADLDEGEPDL